MGMLAIWWRSIAGVSLCLFKMILHLFILHYLRSVSFSGCCPDLMSVCDDGSNASEIHQDLKRFFESAVLGNEGVDFIDRVGNICPLLYS